MDRMQSETSSWGWHDDMWLNQSKDSSIPTGKTLACYVADLHLWWRRDCLRIKWKNTNQCSIASLQMSSYSCQYQCTHLWIFLSRAQILSTSAKFNIHIFHFLLCLHKSQINSQHIYLHCAATVEYLASSWHWTDKILFQDFSSNWQWQLYWASD